MTLNITAIRNDLVCQVSDTRLTTPDGYRDFENKVTLVQCSNAIMSCAFSGIAIIGNKRTDLWLSELLLTLSKDRVETVFDGIALAATNDVDSSVVEAYKKRSLSHMLEFHLAGWARERTRGCLPVWAIISNMWNEKEERVDSPLDRFTVQFKIPNRIASVEGCLALLLGGEVRAVDEAHWNKLLSAGRKAKPGDLIRIMVKTVKVASRHRRYGRYLSRECLSVLLDNREEIPVRFHPGSGATRTVIPMCVRPGIAAGGGIARIPKDWSIKIFPRKKP